MVGLWVLLMMLSAHPGNSRISVSPTRCTHSLNSRPSAFSAGIELKSKLYWNAFSRETGEEAVLEAYTV